MAGQMTLILQVGAQTCDRNKWLSNESFTDVFACQDHAKIIILPSKESSTKSLAIITQVELIGVLESI